MGTSPLKCPACPGDLLAAMVDGHRLYNCEGCHCAVFTIAVLRQVDPTEAKQIWTAPEVPGKSPGPCPFCSQPMAARASATGRLAVCRPCEVLWFDQEAYLALPGQVGAQPPPDAGLASAALPAVRCPICQLVAGHVHLLRGQPPRPGPSGRGACPRAQVPATGSLARGLLGALVEDVVENL